MEIKFITQDGAELSCNLWYSKENKYLNHLLNKKMLEIEKDGFTQNNFHQLMLLIDDIEKDERKERGEAFININYELIYISSKMVHIKWLYEDEDFHTIYILTD